MAPPQASRTPTRRLPGVKPLASSSSSSVAGAPFLMGAHGKKTASDDDARQRSHHTTMGRLAPHHSGISIPRHLDAGRAKEVGGDGSTSSRVGGSLRSAGGPPHSSGSSRSATPSTCVSPASPLLVAQFGQGKFPCELCGRVLQSESDLLQHLENRHVEVNAPGVASSGGSVVELSSSSTTDTSGKLSLGSLMKAEMSSKNKSGSGKGVGAAALSGQVLVTCDLCANSSKVYTLASALFAHIRFKHPAEDAAYHVERLVETSRRQGAVGGASLQRFTCSYCHKVFASDDALQGHITSKHEPDSPTVTRNPATAGALGVVTEKTQWWCNDCEKGFKSGRALLGHRVSKHMLDLKSHNCPACKRVFNDVFSLEEHMKLIHPTLSIEDVGLMAGVLCQFCDRRFLEVKDLQQHLLRHHPGKSTLTKEAVVVTTKGFMDPMRANTVPLHGKKFNENHASELKNADSHRGTVPRMGGGGPSLTGLPIFAKEGGVGAPRLGTALHTMPTMGGSGPEPSHQPSKPRKVSRRK